MTTLPQDSGAHATELHIRYVKELAGAEEALMSFDDPATCYAVLAQGPSTAGNVCVDSLTVAVIPWTGSQELIEKSRDSDPAPQLSVKYRGVDLSWRPGYAVLQCEARQVESLLLAIVEFAHYERELRRLEEEIAGAWKELDEDRPLAFDVTSDHLRHSDVIGKRMEQTFLRRARLARIEGHLYAAGIKLPASAQKMGEELREGAQVEARSEIVSGQIEAFEHVYEMSSQRMGEYRAARQGHIIEWIIIALLAMEVLLMMTQALLRIRS